MPLVNAQCTNCGAMLKIDSNKEAAICEHCGSAFIVEKAINTYNINNLHADVVNITAESVADTEVKAIEALYKLEKYDDASRRLKEFCKDYPQDYRGWVLGVCFLTDYFREQTRVPLKKAEQYYNNAIATMEHSDHSEWLDKYIDYREELLQRQRIFDNTVGVEYNRTKELYENIRQRDMIENEKRSPGGCMLFFVMVVFIVIAIKSMSMMLSSSGWGFLIGVADIGMLIFFFVKKELDSEKISDEQRELHKRLYELGSELSKTPIDDNVFTRL